MPFARMEVTPEQELPGAMAAGLNLDDVREVVLTHAHSINEAIELKAGKRNRSSSRWGHWNSPVCSCEVDALCDQVGFARRVLDCELKVRKGLDESGKE